MKDFDLQKLLQTQMSRKQFLGLGFVAAASIFGITGVLRELASKAATPTASLEPEDATIAGSAALVNDTTASGGGVKFGVTGNGSSIAHGEQLTKAMTGWWALGVVQSDLTAAGDPNARLSNWPGTALPGWIVSTPYVFNNNPSNKGGIVPVGGMVIDGQLVPAGTYVVQFRDFSDQQILVEGSLNGQYGSFAGLMLRGCRWRGPSPYVGVLNENNTVSGGKFWFHYCDMGGLGAQPAQYCEIPIKTNLSPTHVQRCYLSYCTTATQCVGFSGTAILENYIERLTTFNTNGPHINGVSVNGGDVCYRVERNHIVAQPTEDNGSGKAVDQTDCIAFFQDFGNYPGTGTNDDGTIGYRVLNNYLGGTGYCIYGGGGPKGSVSNMQMIGNKITTASYPNGGSFGPMAANPTWGSNGNISTNNVWADGSKVGQTAF